MARNNDIPIPYSGREASYQHLKISEFYAFLLKNVEMELQNKLDRFFPHICQFVFYNCIHFDVELII
jgi:hypothetical protein